MTASPPPPHTPGEELPQQPLTEHLADLRRCLLVSLAAVTAGFALSYGKAEWLADFFFRPLRDALPAGSTLIFTAYQEGFFFT